VAEVLGRQNSAEEREHHAKWSSWFTSHVFVVCEPVPPPRTYPPKDLTTNPCFVEHRHQRAQQTEKTKAEQNQTWCTAI